MKKTNTLIRCFGNGEGKEFYAGYHDNEWGVPHHDDKKLFELLVLEGAQAGLSWETVLKKRVGYRKAFHNFDPKKVARMTDKELKDLEKNPDIIRNKLKIASTRKNAQIFLEIEKEYGTFSHYIWKFVHNKPIKNHWKSLKEIPASTPLSDLISKDLKKRGMSFVGTTIIYAYLQAIGIVNDHITSCWRYTI